MKNFQRIKAHFLLCASYVVLFISLCRVLLETTVHREQRDFRVPQDTLDPLGILLLYQLVTRDLMVDLILLTLEG